MDKSSHFCLCSSLACAMSYGEDKIVQLFLARFTQNDLLDADRTSPLMFACCYGLDKMAKILIESAQVDAQDLCGRSPLMVVKDRSIAEVLLVKGAQIDLQDNDGMSPLMLASKNGCYEMVRFLLEKGAQVNLQNNDGKSALMLSGSGEIAKLLLERGAFVDLLDRYGSQGLLLDMCGIGILQVCSEILDRYPACFPYGQCMARACKGGHSEVVRLLLKHGAIIDNQLLSVVAREGHVGVAKVLLREGTGGDLHSALRCAIEHGQYEMVELFLEGDIQLDNESTTLALLWASKFGNFEITKLLRAQIDLQLGESLSSLKMASCSSVLRKFALMIACHKWFHKVMNTLPSVVHGHNAFDLLSAVEHNPHFDIAKLLLQHGAQISYYLGRRDCFKLLSLGEFQPIYLAQLELHEAHVPRANIDVK